MPGLAHLKKTQIYNLSEVHRHCVFWSVVKHGASVNFERGFCRVTRNKKTTTKCHTNETTKS